jgi:DNA-directed RNA polymerase
MNKTIDNRDGAKVCDSEVRMKQRGEARVWNGVVSKQGDSKNISSTQIGQQIIFEDALKVLPIAREWIEVGSASSYRKELKQYFFDDDILLQRITESFLLLVSTSHIEGGIFNASKRIPTRHRRVATIQTKIMPTLDFDQVWRFLEVIVEASEYFEVEKRLTYRNNKALWNMKYTCTLGEVIANKLILESHNAFFPEPMLVPPTDWSFTDGLLVGGYKHYQYEMVRVGNDTVDYSQYSQKIFDAINYIQRLSWNINKQMVQVVKNDLKMPQKEDFIKTIYPTDEGVEWAVDLKAENLQISEKMIEAIKAARGAFSEKAELYNAEAGDFESALGKYRAVKLALGLAEQLIDEPNLYFPHSYDFRGRIYPLPVGLSPQGSDAVKSMLEYSEGEKLTKSGEEWGWAYLASLYGDDKITFAQRIVRGKELIGTSYLEADEPYQFLAHQLDMQKFLIDNNHKVKARVHLDACNSGSQFTSAITGDRAGCIATNLIPTINEEGGQDRQDAYLLVADRALDLTRKMLKASKELSEKDILYFFEQLLISDGRKLCKRPVMVSNYGGTAGGRSEIIWDTLRELGCERKWITKKNAALFSKIIGESIVGVLNGGKAFEGYIQKMNNIIAKKNRAVVWTTSDGFYVVHKKHKELKAKQVSCMLPGARRITTINKKAFSDKLSAAKMRSAISPNYIHSLDAELLRRVALRLERDGIDNSDWIHDSFGCHPNNVEQLLFVTKDEFKMLSRRTPLRTLDKQLRDQVDASKASQKELELVKVPQLKGFDAINGGLDVVMTSNWFFS